MQSFLGIIITSKYSLIFLRHVLFKKSRIGEVTIDNINPEGLGVIFKPGHGFMEHSVTLVTIIPFYAILPQFQFRQQGHPPRSRQ